MKGGHKMYSKKDRIAKALELLKSYEEIEISESMETISSTVSEIKEDIKALIAKIESEE